MRRRFGQALRIGVAGDALALVRTSRWQGGAELLAEQAYGGGPEAAGKALAALLAGAGCANWPLTIVLSDELVRMWRVTPPQGSARLADLEAAAAMRFAALYGEPAANWQLSAAWDARRPFLAAAVPRALLAALAQGAAAHRPRIVAIVPQLVAVLNQWRAALKPGAWFGLVHDGVLTIAALEAGRVAALRAAALPPGAGPDWLAQHLAREALRLNLAAPARLQLCGQAPLAWRSAAQCSLLAPAPAPDWSAAAVLAASGSRA
jgi:hypothetical protein